MTDGMAVTKGKEETMMDAQPDDGLMPCPFCGGEARVFLSEEGGMWDVQCQGCGAMPYLLSPREARHAGLDPAEELARLWNRRAERTCRIVWGDRHNHAPHCDLCAAVVQEALPSFCPHCGARVVSGNG